ncbi:MAG: hypothetical protein J2P15_11015 [Micromonosporaceae bacterium]|nr:hypothetical protein [Micromonosporaceae bacterium]
MGVLLRVGVTFALGCASATFFLFLRCHGVGRPFGRSSRPWALLVIVITSAVSTAAALLVPVIVDRLDAVFLGLGVIGPSGLWLSEIRNRDGEARTGTLHNVATLWLTRLLARMHEGMAEDRDRWCERRVDDDWGAEEILLAARFYQGYMRDRMSAVQRRRSRINASVKAIEARLAAVLLIERGAARPAVVAALDGSRTTKQPRYARNLDDLHRMADILHHDAQRDLVRLLGYGHDAGLARMPVFTPPPRVYAPRQPAPRQPAGGSRQSSVDSRPSAAARSSTGRNPKST